MAKFIFVAARDPNEPRFVKLSEHALSHVSRELTPDNIRAPLPHFVKGAWSLSCIVNPTASVRQRAESCYLGVVLDGAQNWWKVRSASPEGSYAICRCDEEVAELITDAAGSRSIWYYFDRDILIASSSQRAIIMLLGSFCLNSDAYLWMLSSGTLGPEASWDTRLRLLPPDSKLELRRSSWDIQLTQTPVAFTGEKNDLCLAEQELEGILARIAERIEFDPTSWAVLLSGGYDSRGLLTSLAKKAQSIRTVTWGRAASQFDEQNDAFVAETLARYFGTYHTYMPMDIDVGDIETVFRRFVTLSEGCTDQISGYLDGCGVWKALFESGFLGIVRGDEGFGWLGVNDVEAARRSVGLTTVNDFSNLKGLIRGSVAGGKAQYVPDALLPRKVESIETYRDRLYHAFRLPNVLGPLNEIKCGYVEICNPYTFREVLYFARRLGDGLRTGKPILKNLVRRIGPDIPFARRPAIQAPGDLFATPKVLSYLAESIDPVLAPVSEFRDCALAVLSRAQRGRVGRTVSLAHDVVTNLLRRHAIRRRDMIRYSADYGLLAFRVYIIAAANRMLLIDAGRLSSD